MVLAISRRLSRRLDDLLPRDDLLRNRSFFRIWLAATVAVLGGSVSQLAIPLTAVQMLHAGAAQMGMLFACAALPFALFSLPAGVWIDRCRKRTLIVAFNLLGGAALATVPLAAAFHVLSMPLLYLVQFAVGTAFCVGGSAAQVFMTQVVGRDRLIEANSKQASATSLAGLAGPILAGMLVGWLGAPIAVAVDAAAFIVAATLIATVRFAEPLPQPSRQALASELLEGLRFVWGHPLLRVFAVMAAMCILLFDAFMALYVLRATRDLGLGAQQLAMVNALAALGALTGAVSVHAVNRRVGKPTAIVLAFLATALGFLAYALVAPGAWAVTLAGAAMFLVDAGMTSYTINYLAMRQVVTPDAMLGRMTATMRFLTVSAAPLGSAFAGYCAERFGLAVVIAGIGLLGILAAGLSRWMVNSAVLKLQAEPCEVVAVEAV
jgi:MFS family permease